MSNLRRRAVASQGNDVEVVNISNDRPNQLKMEFTTSTNNEQVIIGYFFHFYCRDLLLDGESVSVTNTSGTTKITVPTAGNHVLYIDLYNTPGITSSNYNFLFKGYYLRLPNGFSRYNSTYPLSINGNTSFTANGVLDILDSTPPMLYGMKWLINTASKIRIPKGTLQTYISADYPSSKLEEVKFKT